MNPLSVCVFAHMYMLKKERDTSQNVNILIENEGVILIINV